VAGFDPALFLVGFVVDKMAVGQFLLCRYFVVCQQPSTAAARRTAGDILGGRSDIDGNKVLGLFNDAFQLHVLWPISQHFSSAGGSAEQRVAI
jgi:hypothetical protein